MEVVHAKFCDGSVAELFRCEAILDIQRSVAALQGIPDFNDVKVIDSTGNLLNAHDKVQTNVSIVINASTFKLHCRQRGAADITVLVKCDMNVRQFSKIVADALNLEKGLLPILEYDGTTLLDKEPLSRSNIQVDSCVDIIGFKQCSTCLEYRSSSFKKKFLGSNASLRFKDELQEGSLVPNRLDEFSCDLSATIICAPKATSQASQGVAVLPSILTLRECTEILGLADGLNICPQQLGGDRHYSRALVHDRSLANILWQRSEALVQHALRSWDLRPLGFGCSQGVWQLAGLNPALRVNQYAGGGFTAPHRDAQYSASADLRSLCTLVIPLQTKGVVRFYQQKRQMDCRGMTLSEEIAAHGGLNDGYTTIDHVYQAGCPVLIGQGVLHEGLPDSKWGPAKALLRTDVLVRRVRIPPLLPILAESEHEDHIKALKLFRKAQQADLQGNCSDTLYEQALSYRYAHPTAQDLEAFTEEVDKKEGNSFDAEKCIGNLPTAALQSHPLLHQHKNFVMPSLLHQDGPLAVFLLSASSSTSDIHEEYIADAECLDESLPTAGHLRVVSMYAFHLLGHLKPRDDDGGDDVEENHWNDDEDHAHLCHIKRGETLYTAKFDPLTYEVIAVPLDKLLSEAFYGRCCSGSVYNVWTKSGQSPEPVEDFARAVDRTHMALVHGCPDIGIDQASQCDMYMEMQNIKEEYAEYKTCTQGKQINFSSLDDSLSDWVCDKQLCQKIEQQVPLCDGYLRDLLDPARLGLPGQDVFKHQNVELTHATLCRGMEDACGQYETNAEVEKKHVCATNSLVFDFDKRSMFIQQLEEKSTSDGQHLAMDDPLNLRLAMEREILGAGLDVKAFTFYSVGLHSLLQGGEHSFNHAGCGCGDFPPEQADYSEGSLRGDTHITHVLLAVGTAEDAFGVTLNAGDILVWTFYHGLAAL